VVHIVLILIRNAVAVGTYIQSPFSFWSTCGSQHMVIWSKPEVYFYPWMNKAVSSVWNWPFHHQPRLGAVPSIKKQKVDPRGCFVEKKLHIFTVMSDCSREAKRNSTLNTKTWVSKWCYIAANIMIFAQYTWLEHFVSLLMLKPCNPNGWKSNMQFKYIKGALHNISR